MENAHLIGFSAGLLAAFTWALASVIFRRLGLDIHPLTLNLYKGLIAFSGLAIILAFTENLLADVSIWAYILLLLSGIIGIGIGDSAFFAALNRLGERQTVLISETMAPLITIILATFIFAEHLSFPALLGVAAILGGIVIVVTERSENSNAKNTHDIRGIVYGLIAASCQATGGIMTKAVFIMQDVDPLWSAMIRLIGGIAFLVIFIPIAGQHFLPQKTRTFNIWKFVFIASLIGTFGGLAFQQMAFKYTYAGIAQTLIATSAVFVLVIAWINKKPVSLKAWAGAFCSIFGVALLFGFQ
jgi:drug/metabolite transporter (DMT)-like permease